jgi:putative ABC transport system permease protein
MFLIKNALQNLRRNFGRNILLSAIVFAIITTTAVTLIINNTANGIIEDYEFRFGCRVNIVPDSERIMENMMEMMRGGGLGSGGNRGGLTPLMSNPQVTAQQSIAFSQLPYVHSYEMTAFQPAFSDILTVDGDADFETGMFAGGGMAQGRGGGMVSMIPGVPGADSDDITLPNLRLYGNHWEDFENGRRSLADGLFPVNYGEAMISVELAELNELKIGDTIRVYTSFTSTDGEDITHRQTARDLTITGIYFDMTPENEMGGFVRLSFLNRRNEILTTLDTVIGDLAENESGVTVTATYYLHDPSQLPYFETAARNLGLNDLLLVTTNEAEYLTIVEPVMGLRDVTSTFMLIVLLLGGVVLVVLAFISVRERKYEIGVLRAMGMKKRKLAFGLMTEMFAITVACLVLGLVAGSLVAQPISDRLLAAQLENIEPNEPEPQRGGMAGMFGGGMNIGGVMGGRFTQLGGGNTPEPLSELDVSLGVKSIVEIIGISLLLAILAGIVSVLRITQYEPMKILMERN